MWCIGKSHLLNRGFFELELGLLCELELGLLRLCELELGLCDDEIPCLVVLVLVLGLLRLGLVSSSSVSWFLSRSLSAEKSDKGVEGGGEDEGKGGRGVTRV